MFIRSLTFHLIFGFVLSFSLLKFAGASCASGLNPYGTSVIAALFTRCPDETAVNMNMSTSEEQLDAALRKNLESGKESGAEINMVVAYSCGPAAHVLSTLRMLAGSKHTCLEAPRFLGIIGPEDPSLLPAVQAITSVFNITHVVPAAPLLADIAANVDDKVVYLTKPKSELKAKELVFPVGIPQPHYIYLILATLLELGWFDLIISHVGEGEPSLQLRWLITHGNRHGLCFLRTDGDDASKLEDKKYLPAVVILGSRSGLGELTRVLKGGLANSSLLVYSSSADTAPRENIIGTHHTVVWIQAVSNTNTVEKELDARVDLLQDAVQILLKARNNFIKCKKSKDTCTDWSKTLETIFSENYNKQRTLTFSVYLKLPSVATYQKIVRLSLTEDSSIDDIQYQLRNCSFPLNELQDNTTSMQFSDDKCVDLSSTGSDPTLPRAPRGGAGGEVSAMDTWTILGVIGGSAVGLLLLMAMCIYAVFRQMQETVEKDSPSRAHSRRSSRSTNSD